MTKLTKVNADKALGILNSLIADGHVVIVGKVVLGQASDGVTVDLGQLSTYPDREALYRYLLDNPTPDKW